VLAQKSWQVVKKHHRLK